MRALKALRAGAVGPFSGFRWPTPGDGPGRWVAANSSPCASGVHACLRGQLPLWPHDELGGIELGRAVTALERKVVAPWGRLVRRVEGWDAGALVEYGEACLARLEALAVEHAEVRGYAADGRVILAQDEPLVVALAAARAAEVVSGPGGYDEERAWQADWLAERLELDAG
jgi:hypothetical protein